MNATSRRSLSGGLRALGIAALCVAGLPNAHARSNDDYVKGDSITVRYGDLNLQNPAGTEELYRRIKRAAEKVCGPAADRHVLSNDIRTECVERAVANAVSDVNNTHLTALHARKSHKAVG